MTTLSVLSLLLLAAPSEGLIDDPSGFLGFTWGMTPGQAKAAATFSLSCPSGSAPTIECTATLPNVTQEVLNKDVQSKVSLVFKDNLLVKIWLFRGDAAPGSTVLQLHNLFGTPTHEVLLPAILENVMLYSWIKRKTVINLEVGPTIDKVTSISITVYNANYYRTLKAIP